MAKKNNSNAEETNMADEQAVEIAAPRIDLTSIPVLELESDSGPAVSTGEREAEIPVDSSTGTGGASELMPPSEAEINIPDEYPEELTASEPPSPELSDRQKFYALKFNELDRRLTPAERAEWNAIYASYRGRSALHGTVLGVNPMSAVVFDRQTRVQERQTKNCAVIVPYRIPIFIPEDELWTPGDERPDFVSENITGANLDFIITKVDRLGKYAVASRKLATRARRYYFTHRPALCTEGARITCKLLSVADRRCLAECYGYDIGLTQRELSYTAIPSLKEKYHPGQELPCIFKGFDPETKKPIISVKETEPNPFDDAVFRHPEGCRRMATIAGKYGGGVFCNLPDGVVLMCNYSYQHEDSDFMIGDTVILVVQSYNMERKQIYGKILSKW